MLNHGHIVIRTLCSTWVGPKGSTIEIQDLLAWNCQTSNHRERKFTKRMVEFSLDPNLTSNNSLNTISRLMEIQKRSKFTKLEAEFIAAEFGHQSWSILEKCNYERPEFFKNLGGSELVNEVVDYWFKNYVEAKKTNYTVDDLFEKFFWKNSCNMPHYYTEDEILAIYLDRPEVLMSLGYNADDLIRIKAAGEAFDLRVKELDEAEKNYKAGTVPSFSTLRRVPVPAATNITFDVATGAGAVNFRDLATMATDQIRIDPPGPPGVTGAVGDAGRAIIDDQTRRMAAALDEIIVRADAEALTGADEL